jgi:hypothetical protein
MPRATACYCYFPLLSSALHTAAPPASAQGSGYAGLSINHQSPVPQAAPPETSTEAPSQQGFQQQQQQQQQQHEGAQDQQI